MIVDCFTFFNEMDLLEVRINVLAPYVDAFVLCEANRTFQGAEKPYRFERGFVWKDAFGCGKPLYVVRADLSRFDRMQVDEPEVPGLLQSVPWAREAAQRRDLVALLSTLSPDDRIILSDVDEIPGHSAFGADIGLDTIALDLHQVCAWKQDLYYYWVNMRCWRWIGPVSCTWKTVRDRFHCDLQALRDHRHQAPLMIDGGWHFSFLGGADAIKAKIEAFSHTEYLWAAEPANIDYALQERWKENRDLFGRLLPGMRFELMPDDSHLPPYLEANKERFKDWWYSTERSLGMDRHKRGLH